MATDSFTVVLLQFLICFCMDRSPHFNQCEWTEHRYVLSHTCLLHVPLSLLFLSKHLELLDSSSWKRNRLRYLFRHDDVLDPISFENLVGADGMGFDHLTMRSHSRNVDLDFCENLGGSHEEGS